MRRTANDKLDLYVSTSVKVGGGKGRDGEVGYQLQGECKVP